MRVWGPVVVALFICFVLFWRGVVIHTSIMHTYKHAPHALPFPAETEETQIYVETEMEVETQAAPVPEGTVNTVAQPVASPPIGETMETGFVYCRVSFPFRARAPPPFPPPSFSPFLPFVSFVRSFVRAAPIFF
jgi:hypothetical protein